MTWCRTTASRCSSPPVRSSSVRASGPAARSNGRRAVAGEQPPGLWLGIRQGAQVDDRQRRRGRRQDDLHGDAAGTLPEDGAQRLVAPGDLPQGPRQQLRAEGAAQPERAGDVVGGALRLELLEEPEPLLGEGERLPRRIARQPAAAAAGRRGLRRAARRDAAPGRPASAPRTARPAPARRRRPRASARSPGWRAASGRRERRSRRGPPPSRRRADRSRCPPAAPPPGWPGRRRQPGRPPPRRLGGRQGAAVELAVGVSGRASRRHEQRRGSCTPAAAGAQEVAQLGGRGRPSRPGTK